jgi:hypothetical protein
MERLNMTEKSDGVVKIDGKLLKELEEFINKENNKLLYANKRQFVSIAVLEKLNREKQNKINNKPK